MEQPVSFDDPKRLATEIDAEIHALHVRNTPNERAVRRKYSRLLKGTNPAFVLDVARALHHEHGYWGTAFELIASHRQAFQRMGEAELEEFGQGMDSWWTVDSFARTLSGPAWLKGQVTDELIHRWAVSEDLWWRRAALVSTVALNVRSRGGHGDVPHTLTVCHMLAGDHEDMVVKGLSWALRELVPHNPDAVRAFLNEHNEVLAARVKREVNNKLTMGLKNPKRATS
jgi:3-methyladenine DNA glycosylase AlkD